jgi:hypothetical protein
MVQVNYINAHATSTLVGDVAELNAVKKVFTNTKHIKMNGTKSMTGHSLGAAGGLEGIALIKAIQTGWVHPTINQVPHFLYLQILFLSWSRLSIVRSCVAPLAVFPSVHKVSSTLKQVQEMVWKRKEISVCRSVND